jgi:2-keto-4-pentenoate hydratase
MSDSSLLSFIEARAMRGLIGLDQAPASLEEAYAISASMMAALGQTVGGWKVGYAPDGTPIAAPMYAAGFLASGDSWTMRSDRPMIPEIEIAVRLAHDLPANPRQPYTRADILDAASVLLIGVELIERRIPMQGAPFAMNLADDLGNAGYVLGPSTRDFRALDLPNLHCRFWMNGELVVDRRGGHPSGDPLKPLVDWANAQKDQVGGLRGGQIVTLGSLTPLVVMPGPGPLEAEIEGMGRISAVIV